MHTSIRSNGTPHHGGVGIGARIWLLAAALIAAAYTHAAESDCRTITSATARLNAIPNHQYITDTGPAVGPSPRQREEIYTGPHYYTKEPGSPWQVSAITPEELESLRHESQADDGALACSYLRDEAVDGELAAVYRQDQQKDTIRISTLYWISKSRGLLLKQELDLDVGGRLGKTHRSTRFVYTGISAPAGSK